MSLSFKQFIKALKELGVQVEKPRERTVGTERKETALLSSAATDSEGEPARFAAGSKQTTTEHFEEAVASSMVLNKSAIADGTAMDKMHPFPAIAPPEEENGIIRPMLLLKKKPEEVDFAHFHQELPVRPESQRKAEGELEARSLENADLQYVVRSFIKLQNEQPDHYRLGYLRKLLLQAIEEFKRKKVLDKVHRGKESHPFFFFGLHFVDVFWHSC